MDTSTEYTLYGDVSGDHFNNIHNVKTIYWRGGDVIKKGTIPDRRVVVFLPEGYPISGIGENLPKQVAIVLHVSSIEQNCKPDRGVWFTWSDHYTKRPNGFKDIEYDSMNRWIYENGNRNGINKFSDYWRDNERGVTIAQYNASFDQRREECDRSFENIKPVMDLDETNRLMRESEEVRRDATQEAEDIAHRCRDDMGSLSREGMLLPDFKLEYPINRICVPDIVARYLPHLKVIGEGKKVVISYGK